MRACAPQLDLNPILAPIAPALGQVEQRLAEQVIAFDPTLSEYVHHALDSPGKRLRPALSLLGGMAAADASETLSDDHIDLGVIVELIHIATLVHDDVMDQAELRHNQPTSRARWGNEIAVLLGDILFAHALQLAAAFPTPEVCRCVSGATNTVCSGEILQTRRRFDPTLSIDEYLKIIEMKTATLFAVSCDLGAFLSGAPASTRRALRNYGNNLGAAYQIYDDCLDIFGQESLAGKSLGTDLARGKFTLPVLIYLAQASPRQRTILIKELSREMHTHRQVIRQILNERQALDHSLRMLDHYLRQAQISLEKIENRDAARALIEITQFLATQAHALLGRSTDQTSLPVVVSAGAAAG